MSVRLSNTLGFLICAALLGYAYYLQYYEYLDPCPLCIFQRVAVAAIGLVFLLAAIHARGRIAGRVYALALALAGAAGTAIAGRHVWLQNLPPEQVPECGPGLEFMLRTMPFNETLSRVLNASGECAEISWTFLTVSMPGWVAIWCVLLGLGGLLVNWRRPA